MMRPRMLLLVVACGASLQLWPDCTLPPDDGYSAPLAGQVRGPDGPARGGFVSGSSQAPLTRWRYGR